MMYGFFIDKCGKKENENEEDDKISENEVININVNDENESITLAEKIDIFENLPELDDDIKLEKKEKKGFNVNDSYIILNYANQNDVNFYSSNLQISSLEPGLEKKHTLPIVKEKILKQNRKKLREMTKGENWYNLPATEVTDKIKTDLKILKMRSVLSKNHFYKKNDIKNISKYFQVGTVVENSADFYSGRIVKSLRKKTVVDELLADAECKNYQRKKYKEIMDTKRWKKHFKHHSKNPTNCKGFKGSKKNKETKLI